jgi:hypothetical protein
MVTSEHESMHIACTEPQLHFSRSLSVPRSIEAFAAIGRKMPSCGADRDSEHAVTYPIREVPIHKYITPRHETYQQAGNLYTDMSNVGRDNIETTIEATR